MAFFGIAHGLRGWFAIVYDDAGPILTGLNSFDNEYSAYVEAVEWALCEGTPHQKAAIHREFEAWKKKQSRDDFDF
jgi:hypothetical protein